MQSKKKLLRDSRLYAVVDRGACGRRSLVAVALAAVRAGAGVVQLRDKTSPPRTVVEEARALSRALAPTKALFIVNDYLDVARIVMSDGVHIGQSDGSLALARTIMGRELVIGVSCDSVAQAVAAEQGGADYIGVGALFTTPTKPAAHPVGSGIFGEVCAKTRIPVFAIGGITMRTLPEARLEGARRIAVSSAICQARDPYRAAVRLLAALQ